MRRVSYDIDEIIQKLFWYDKSKSIFINMKIKIKIN